MIFEEKQACLFLFPFFSFAKGFLHKLGHSLGLRDECVDCQQLSLAGPPNCAATKEEAQKWWGDLVGKVALLRRSKGILEEWCGVEE